MLDKSKYSFLIGFVRQLAAALDDADAEPDLAIHLGSLAQSLVLLHADWDVDLGDDDGGDAEGVDDVDAPGDDTPLGAALARIAELERAKGVPGTPAAVDVTRRRLVGGGTIDRAGTQEPVRGPVVRQRRKPAVLKRPGSGHSTPLRGVRSKRRGKK